MSFYVCMKRPTGRAAHYLEQWRFQRPQAGWLTICLCFQMAGAAATKGQQNVTRTRAHTGWRARVCDKRVDTPRWRDTQHGILFGITELSPAAAGGAEVPPVSEEISGYNLPSGSSSLCVEGCV